MAIQSLAVFCGSKSGRDPLYAEHARRLGSLLAARGVTLVYGGGSTGLMGELADAAMNHGGRVIGIIPRLLVEWEHQHERISELVVVDDMHTRKRNLYERSDAAVVLPGGFGTLDELFEMLTWNQLAIHEKRIFFLNSGGFFEHLLRHLRRLAETGFLYDRLEDRLTMLEEPEQLDQYLL
ncbi:MAG TPA: TIGR00730 family Rossman fold protein [Chitinophagaceae bacterium]|nr:TIGR00730 family Rossman fold protein [Chitinophagaceae bacterium]